jgi:hypothetical protein
MRQLSTFQKDKIKTLFRQGDKTMDRNILPRKDIQLKTVYTWIKAGDIKVADMIVFLDALYTFYDNEVFIGWRAKSLSIDDTEVLANRIINYIEDN